MKRGFLIVAALYSGRALEWRIFCSVFALRLYGEKETLFSGYDVSARCAVYCKYTLWLFMLLTLFSLSLDLTVMLRL